MIGAVVLQLTIVWFEGVCFSSQKRNQTKKVQKVVRMPTTKWQQYFYRRAPSTHQSQSSICSRHTYMLLPSSCAPQVLHSWFSVILQPLQMCNRVVRRCMFDLVDATISQQLQFLQRHMLLAIGLGFFEHRFVVVAQWLLRTFVVVAQWLLRTHHWRRYY